MSQKNKRAKMIRRRQRKLKRDYTALFAMNLLFVFAIMLFAIMFGVRGNNQIEGGIGTTVHESMKSDHATVIPPANASNEETTTNEETTPKQFCRNLSDEDKYLLAKIAMAEAEGENIECKIMVILTVLNRVESSLRYFPDTVSEVIFQCNNGVYQFTPVAPGGRWYRVEPNEECWEAVEIVNTMEEDISNGALYFESLKGESWHSRNLEFICKIGPMKFYK